jgi:LPS-assembly protein
MVQNKTNRKYIIPIHRHIGFDRRPIIPLLSLLLLASQSIIVAYQIIVPVPLAAQLDVDQIGKAIQDKDLPWQLEADVIDYDQTLDEYTAKGNVIIYKGNIKLMADYVRFDRQNMQAYAEGDVILTNGEDILSGSSMEIDLENQIGSVENGYLFLKENNYHLSGEVIKKVGEKTYTIDDATLTTCDGEKPDWKITGSKVKIKEDGEGTARNAMLYARNMPVLYTPYFYYPARKKRQTGFLIPEGGISDRWGWYYNQPFFWAIDESSDATFYGHYMNSRGLRGGIEYRYYLDNWSKGTLMVNGLRDKQIDDGTGGSSQKWGFEDGKREILRKNQDRYWFLMSHHQKMPWNVRARLELDIVSDQDYTRDWQNGHMGWSQAKSYFEEVFNWDIDDFNDPIRTNRLNFNKIWPKYSLNAQLRYDLNSTIRNTGNLDLTLQQLPVIEFDGVKQRIAKSPFFYNLNSQYVYYWTRDAERGQRTDLFPRVYLPLRFKPFVTIEPSVGARSTLWYLDQKDFGPDDDKQFYHRELYDTRLDLFSEVNKVFRFEGQKLEAAKHTIRPRIIHEFIPDVDQEDLPKFDSTDRIKKKNLLTYSLTNTLTSKIRKSGTSKTTRRVDPNQASVINSPAEYAYNDFLRFKLEQSYDINEANEGDPERPFSPILAELDVFPGKYVALDSDAFWSVYEMKLLSYNVLANLWDARGDSLAVEYRYTEESGELDLNPAHSIYTRLQLKVTDRLRVSADYEYNFRDDTRVQTGFGINYKSQCWSFEGSVKDSVGVDGATNLDFEVKVNLYGLGEFGI